MRTIKLTLEYDGTDFSGWQVQPRRRTVQGVISESLETILREPVTIIGSGRTDAGVHARGQVASFTTAASLSFEEIRRALNSLLPDDVVVRRVQHAAPDFHARFDAIQREYRYRIIQRPTALQRRYVWHLRWPVDLDLMQRGAALLSGTHDFRACCLGPEKKRHCRCEIYHSSLHRREGEIHFRIAANRFLHSMVRILAGWLVELGRQRVSLDQFADLLKGDDPAHSPPPVAPAQGLCLMRVRYPT
jgi:tRNA pseudouridine38-40 synthase